jgi:L-asparaginase
MADPTSANNHTNSAMMAIFTTGGTIDKLYFDAKSEFSVGDPQITSVLEEANVTFTYIFESIIRKDSLELTAADITLIRNKVLGSDVRRILITHGTDTMLTTAKALKSCHCPEKTIVLIGAMRPKRMCDSDAHFNIGYGVAATQLLPPGVYVAMNGHVFDPDDAIKNRDKSRFELASPGELNDSD